MPRFEKKINKRNRSAMRKTKETQRCIKQPYTCEMKGKSGKPWAFVKKQVKLQEFCMTVTSHGACSGNEQVPEHRPTGKRRI